MYELSLFIAQYFFIDESQNLLIFQPNLNTFTIHAVFSEATVAWESRRLSNQKVRSYITSDKILYPKLNLYNSSLRVEFKGCCLKQNKVTFNTSNVVNLFIVYELDRWS